jgi:hypothetical protein
MRIKIRQAEAASSIILISGLATLTASVFYSSSTLALIGLGLTFWGALLLYIRPEEYTRKTILNATVLPVLATLNQMIRELNYKGEAVYLPPRYFANPESTKIYIIKQSARELRAKQKVAGIPLPELIQKYENRLIIRKTEGLLLTPPGAELTKIFEKKLGTSFTKVDLEYLQRKMPRLFTEDLEIAENLEIEILPGYVAASESDLSSFLQAEYYRVHVKITDPICREICEESNRPVGVCGKIGCPICSSIGCALTKATGAPVIIESAQTSKNEKTVEVTYGILGIKS